MRYFARIELQGEENVDDWVVIGWLLVDEHKLEDVLFSLQFYRQSGPTGNYRAKITKQGEERWEMYDEAAYESNL